MGSRRIHGNNLANRSKQTDPKQELKQGSYLLLYHLHKVTLEIGERGLKTKKKLSIGYLRIKGSEHWKKVAILTSYKIDFKANIFTRDN